MAPPRNTESKEIDSYLAPLVREASLLPYITPINAVEERGRLIEAFQSGKVAKPAWRYRRNINYPKLRSLLHRARATCPLVPAAHLYEQRLNELECDIAILASLGDRKALRPHRKLRFKTADVLVPWKGKNLKLIDVAHELMSRTSGEHEAKTLPSFANKPPSFAHLASGLAMQAGLHLEVRREPSLAARVAVGGNTLLISATSFGPQEALRLAVHEVLGHVLTNTNANSQSLGILRFGTAGALRHQEGVAISLEEKAGVLSPGRIRMLAARVLAAQGELDGGSFHEVCKALCSEYGFTLPTAVRIAERAFRGGGLGRELIYLHGFLELRKALRDNRTSLFELQSARLDLCSLKTFRELQRSGLAKKGSYCSKRALSRLATFFGTSLDTSPPKAAASFTTLELT